MTTENQELEGTDEVWWDLTIESPGDDAAIEEVMDRFDIAGFEIIGNHLRTVIQKDTEAELVELLEAMKGAGIEVISYELFDDSELLAAQAELEKPVPVKDLTVVPILDPTKIPDDLDTKAIYIVPGTGFGTGKHESTRFVLELLQHPALREAAPEEVLDVGTGSGVLAIGYCRLFNGKVVGFDIEELAIENAKKNRNLNKLEERIELLVGGTEVVDKKYDLVTANITAPVLCELEEELASFVKPGGHIILSGIMAGLRFEIENIFIEDSTRWEEVESLDENGWSGFLLKRK